MLHRASSPSPIPPAVVRPHVRLSHIRPPALPEKAGQRHLLYQSQSQSTTTVPPVPPPLSAPRPPKTTNKDTTPKQDHHYENTILIHGTREHVVKNINLEMNRAKFTALMKSREEPGGSSIKPTEGAAYENVNVEHISRLTALGFAQDAVIRALGISRNDLEMACDILNEFATKSS